MRYFNTSGPVVAGEHYRIPPLARMNLVELRQLVAWKRCFVLHAPRQTGKADGPMSTPLRPAPRSMETDTSATLRESSPSASLSMGLNIG